MFYIRRLLRFLPKPRNDILLGGGREKWINWPIINEKIIYEIPIMIHFGSSIKKIFYKIISIFIVRFNSLIFRKYLSESIEKRKRIKPKFY